MYAETFSEDEYVDSVGEERVEVSAYDAADTRYMGVANGQVFQLCALQRAAEERGGANAVTTSVTSDMEDTLRHTMLPTSSPSPRGVELATTTYSSDMNNNNNNSIDLYSERLSHTLGLHHNASVLSFRSPVMASAEARRAMRGRSASVANSPSMATRLAWQDSFFRGAAVAEEGDEASSASTTNEMDSSADGLHMCHASSCIDCTTTPRPYSASELDHASFMTPTRRAASTEANGMAAGLCSPDQFFLSYVPHAAQTQDTSDSNSQSALVTAHTPARAFPHYASGSSPVLSDGAAPHTTNANAEGSNSTNTTQHAGAEAHRPVLHLGSRGASSGGRHGSQGCYTTPIAPPHQHSPSRRDASPQLRPPQRLSLPPSATITQHTRYYSFCSYGAGAATNTTGTSSSCNGMTAELCTPVRHGESELLWSSASPQRPRSQTRSSLSTANSPGYHTTGSMPRPFSVPGQSASQGRPPLRRPSLPAQSTIINNSALVTALRSPQSHTSQSINGEGNANTIEGASAPPPVLYERVLNAPGMAVQENMSLIHWGCAGLLVVLDSGVYLRQDTPSVHCVFVNTAARRTTRVSCVVSSRTPLHCCLRANYPQSMNIEAGATNVEETIDESGEMLYMVFGLNTGTVLVHEYRAEPVASTQHAVQEGHLVQNDATGFVWCAQAMQRRFMRRTGIATLHCDVGCEGTAGITSMHLAGHTLYVGGMRGVLLVYDLQRCVFAPTTHGASNNNSHSSNNGVRNAGVDTISSALHARTHSFPSTIFPRHHFLTGLQATTTTTTLMTDAAKEPSSITNTESNTLAPPALRGLCVGSPIFHIAVTEDRNHIALGTQDGLLIYHEGQLQVHHHSSTTSSDTRIEECGDATYFVRATRPAADTPSEPQVVLRGTMTPVRAFDWLYRPTVPYNTTQGTSFDECHTLHDTPHGSIARTGATQAAHGGIEYSPAGTIPLMTGMRSAVLVYGHECELGVYVLGTGRTVVRRTLPRAIHAIVCSRTSNEIIACTEMSADELGHYRVQRRPATPLAGQTTPSPVQQQSTSASYNAAWTQLRRAMTHQSTTSFSSSSWSSTPSASPAHTATTATSPAGRAVAPAMPILALRPTASPSRPAAMGQTTTTSVAQQPFTQVPPQVRGPLYLLELQLSEEGVSDHTYDVGTMQEGDFSSSMRKGPVLRLKGCYGSETRSAVVYTALSPDGTQLATAGPEEMVRFWRLALRKQKAVDPITNTETTLSHTGPLRHWRYLTGVLSSGECGTASALDLSPSCAITPLMVSEALR